jgi:hypothetical protein
LIIMNTVAKRLSRRLLNRVAGRSGFNARLFQLNVRFNTTDSKSTETEPKKDGINESKTETEELNETTAADEPPVHHKYDATAASSSTSLQKFDADEYDDWEPKTAKEKVSYYSQIAFTLGLLGLGAACVYVFIKEVNPFGRSPQSIFDHAVDRLVIRDEVLEMTGPGPRAYGRDHGSQAEGRRNIVDSRVYKERDGSQRTRVRFNLKGPKGRVMVWAEVSDKMPHNEYVYLICQDMRTRRVLTVEDNRARLETEMEVASIGSGGSGGAMAGAEDAKAAMMKLLGGGK